MKNIDRTRHIAKAFTWRLIATFITFTMAWTITGEVKVGLTLGGLDIIIKLIAYYIHERLWYKTNFGIRHTRGDENNVKKG